MSRDKQIEEMARGMCLLSARLKCSECSDKCQYCDFAERLYKNGYRKAAYVATEIFTEIGKHIVFNTYGIATISEKTFAELKNKYTESEVNP